MHPSLRSRTLPPTIAAAASGLLALASLLPAPVDAASELVLICHATGSDSNAVVILTVDDSGLSGHGSDEVAANPDCTPAGGGSGGSGGGSGGSGGGSGGSGGSGGGTDGSGGSTGSGSTGSGGSGTGGTGSTGSGGSGSGASSSGGGRTASGSGGGPSSGTGTDRRMTLESIGAAAPEPTIGPIGRRGVGGDRSGLPATDVLAAFLARSPSGRTLGLGLLVTAGIGTFLLVLFGSLAARRR